MNDFVAFGSWRCNCSVLAEQLQEIPDRCPSHDQPLLLGQRSWEANPHNVPLGITPDYRLAS